MIKSSTKNAIDRYVVEGLQTGSFLEAVLSNDLREAFGRADIDNRHSMFDIVEYLYNNVPSVCWGSSEAYREWLNLVNMERAAITKRFARNR